MEANVRNRSLSAFSLRHRKRFCGQLLLFSMVSALASGQSALAPLSSENRSVPVTMKLWPTEPPGLTASTRTSETSTAGAPLVAGKTVLRVTNVSIPTITLYKPQKADTGTAVVVFPGGGWRLLAMDLEGTEVCEWLNSIGVSCILLKYRVPDSGPYPKSPASLQDAQRALGLVRQHASEWHIDPTRIGVLGFSAGGNLAASLSTHFQTRLYKPVDEADRLSCRPDFTMLIYPGALHEAKSLLTLDANVQPTHEAPPAFLVQAENDPVHVENAVDYFLALKAVKVPAELHVYAEGGHGFGLRASSHPITAWSLLAQTWMHTIGVLPPLTH